ncbi:hypothetical protein J3D48_000127 [Pseudomonas fluorescens]|nr:hypothetical protein [Pseudomonas fluorescens]
MNRDDHPKNFAYIMSPGGDWKLAPAYDVTFCEGPGGYHQMDVMGEALEIGREHLLNLAVEAKVNAATTADIIDRFCEVASRFSAMAESLYPGVITQETLRTIQQRIDQNIGLLA